METGTKLSKTGTKTSKTQSNGRVKPVNLNKPVWDPYNQCVLIPLGSPTGCQNWLLVHVWHVELVVVGWVYSTGTGVGYGTRVGIPGSTTQPPSCSREVLRQRSGPRNPARGGVGGLRAGTSGLHVPPLPAVGPASLYMYPSPSKTRLWANKGEITVIFIET